MTRLEKLRKRLGQCDEILLDAILMRHHIIKDIMAYKEENGLNILDCLTEKKIHDKIFDKARELSEKAKEDENT